MPRSKLRSSMSVDEVQGIQAVREKVDIETVTVNNRLIKRPKFMREQISPRFRAVGSIETDEIEYDNYIKWVVSKSITSASILDAVRQIRNWPMFRRDPFGTAFQPYGSVSSLSQVWTVDVGNEWTYCFTPIIGRSGNIYVIGRRSVGSSVVIDIHKVSPDGSILNTYTISEMYAPYSYEPAVSFDEQILVAIATSYDKTESRMVVIDADTFSLINSYNTTMDSSLYGIGGPVTISPDGRYFVGFVGKDLVIYDKNNDEFSVLTRPASLKPPINYGTSVVFDLDGNIYVKGFHDGNSEYLAKYDKNGNLLWCVPIGLSNIAGGSPLYYDDKIYVWGEDANTGYTTLRIYNCSDGSLVGEFNDGSTQERTSTSPIINLNTEDIYLFHWYAYDGFFKYSIRDKQLIKMKPGQYSFISKTPSIASNGNIVCFLEDGSVYVMDSFGNILQTLDPGMILGSPAIDDNGNVYMLDREYSKLIKFA